MTPKRGQPPKPPEKKRTMYGVYLSPEEKEVVEEARDMEAPDRRLGAYIRDTAVDHAKEVTGKK